MTFQIFLDSVVLIAIAADMWFSRRFLLHAAEHEASIGAQIKRFEAHKAEILPLLQAFADQVDNADTLPRMKSAPPSPFVQSLAEQSRPYVTMETLREFGIK
jgi:hypothetical protein